MLVADSKQSISMQVDFDEQKLKDLVSKLFNNTKIEEVRYLSYAYTNKTMLFRFPDNRKVVVKVCVKEDRYPKLKLEVELIKRLGDETKLPIPKILHQDLSRDLFDYPFVIYSYLNGENLVDAMDYIADKKHVGIELARLSAEIHKIRIPNPSFSLATPYKGESWVGIINEICSNGIEALRSHNYERTNEIESYVNANITSISEPEQYCLIHRDLQPQNVHWDNKTKKVKGIFDFESAMSGDNLFEFNFLERQLFRTYPEMREPFYSTYSKISKLRPDFKKVVKFYEVVRDLYFFPRDLKYGELDRANGDIESLERTIFKDLNVG